VPCRAAYRAGVTYATSSLYKSTNFDEASTYIGGLAATFRTGAAHALEPGAIIRRISALHVHVGRPSPVWAPFQAVSVSTQIAVLRRLLLDGVSEDEETGRWFKKAADVSMPRNAFYLYSTLIVL
jgi:hypothetical protein